MWTTSYTLSIYCIWILLWCKDDDHGTHTRSQRQKGEVVDATFARLTTHATTAVVSCESGATLMVASRSDIQVILKSQGGNEVREMIGMSKEVHMRILKSMLNAYFSSHLDMLSLPRFSPSHPKTDARLGVFRPKPPTTRCYWWQAREPDKIRGWNLKSCFWWTSRFCIVWSNLCGILRTTLCTFHKNTSNFLRWRLLRLWYKLNIVFGETCSRKHSLISCAFGIVSDAKDVFVEFQCLTTHKHWNSIAWVKIALDNQRFSLPPQKRLELWENWSKKRRPKKLGNPLQPGELWGTKLMFLADWALLQDFTQFDGGGAFLR